ncbi:hypothetical protein [Paracidovorax citrulli]
MERATMEQPRPWWREPWPWLLMSGPAAAMVACGVTIWLASANADRPLTGVSRLGLVVEQTAAALPDPGRSRERPVQPQAGLQAGPQASDGGQR